jgi:hypothetical protein
MMKAMKIDLSPDFPVTDDACREATGKSLGEWFDAIAGVPEYAGKRRETINWLWDQTGRSPAQAWWGTTIWVEYERSLNRVQKDGRPEGYNICVTKTVKAPVDDVLKAIVETIPSDKVLRVREGKDVKAGWHTEGVASPTEIEATVKDTAGKVAIAVMHKRIDTRDEADGLRRAWQARLDEIKKELEG